MIIQCDDFAGRGQVLCTTRCERLWEWVVEITTRWCILLCSWV